MAKKYKFTQRLPATTSVQRKKEITLECALDDPRAQVKWYKNGEEITVRWTVRSYKFFGLCTVIEG